MSTKVLVTGGAGYLGSILTNELLLRGFEVRVLDNFMYGQQSLSHLCAHNKLGIIRGDARLLPHNTELMKWPDVFVPLAAIVGAVACDANPEAWEVNCRAVGALVNNASPQQVIIFPNTNSGYGKGGEEALTEDAPLEPVSAYGSSKVKAEEIVLRHPLGISLRFATLFGSSPRMRLDLLVNEFVYRAVEDGFIALYEGGFRRNFLHVRDASSAILHAIRNHKSMAGKPFNAGRSDANMTKDELCKKISEYVTFTWAKLDNVHDPDQRDYIISNKRLEQSGWAPRYSLEEGIAELIRCYEQPFGGRLNRNA